MKMLLYHRILLKLPLLIKMVGFVEVVVVQISLKSSTLLCPGVIIRFRPTDYTVSEGVDGVVTLSVIKLGLSDIPVAATLTTVSGTAEGMELLRCYYFPLHTIHYFPNRWYRLYKS